MTLRDRIKEYVQDRVADVGTERAEIHPFVVAREIEASIESVVPVLYELASKNDRNRWLAPMARVSCPQGDEHPLADLPVDDGLPDVLPCRRHGEVEIDPGQAWLFFKPTSTVPAQRRPAATAKKKMRRAKRRPLFNRKGLVSQ